MTQAQLAALKQDFLDWTGGFGPEREDDILTYIASSMPFDLDRGQASQALRQWLEAAESVEVRRDVDQH